MIKRERRRQSPHTAGIGVAHRKKEHKAPLPKGRLHRVISFQNAVEQQRRKEKYEHLGDRWSPWRSTASCIDSTCPWYILKTYQLCLTLGENIRQTKIEAHSIKRPTKPLQSCQDHQKYELSEKLSQQTGGSGNKGNKHNASWMRPWNRKCMVNKNYKKKRRIMCKLQLVIMYESSTVWREEMKGGHDVIIA